MPVQTERKDYSDMKLRWARMRDTFGGRDDVLKAGARYVPDLRGLDADANAAYRARGNFYNATQRTTVGLVGTIFQEPPDIKFPPALEEYLADISLSGIPFETFASDVGRELMTVGRHGVLIDMPPAPAADGAAPAGAQRAYCVGYKAEDIVNWQTARVGAATVLTLVVLRENIDQPDPKDEFSAACLEQYRVLRLVGGQATVQLWREKTTAAKEYAPVSGPVALTRRGVPLTFIPFVFMSSAAATADLEKPPLLDLADVNLAHWRNSVDHEYGLHQVALPTPWVAGSRGSKDGPMRSGPSVVWELEIAGSAGMLEFTGKGLEAIVAAMEEKKKQMAILGARLLEDPAGVERETATAVRMRHSGEHASLRTIAGAIERGLSTVLQYFAWWSGTETAPSDVAASVALNKEYLDVKPTAQEVQVALTALQAGEISFETWFNFLSTGSWVRDDVDVEDERSAITKDRALAPEPALDPALSPGDPAAGPAKPAAPKTKTVTGPDGALKYTITEGA